MSQALFTPKGNAVNDFFSIIGGICEAGRSCFFRYRRRILSSLPPDPEGVTDISLGSRFATPGKERPIIPRPWRGRRREPVMAKKGL